MSKGGKIALGCGIVALLAIGAVAVMLIGGAWWAKGKVEKAAASFKGATEEMNKYEQKANEVPFTAPPDGVIPEARLVTFIDVRKRVYSVYEQYKSDFEGMKDRKDASFSDAMKIAGLVKDIRLAQMKGLAESGMSESEYRFIQMAVYQSAWAAGIEKETGKSISEAVADAKDKVQTAAGQGIDTVGQAKVEGLPQASQEDLDKAKAQMSEAMSKMAEAAKAVEAPKANIELFRKYEADLKKYAMVGLGIIGL